MFLSSVPVQDGGGHTAFGEVDVKVLPRLGDAIVWMNVDDSKQQEVSDSDGEMVRSLLDEAVHVGLPPVSEDVVKYACNVWVREVELDAHVAKEEAYTT